MGCTMGTFAVAFMLKEIFTQEFTLDIIELSFGISALVCIVAWYKKKR